MTNQTENDFDALRAIEKERLAPLKEKSPHLFTRAAAVDPDETLARIGIRNLPDRSAGYLRLLPQDFIVEEVTPEGYLATIEPEPLPTTTIDDELPTIYADLVKLGIGTPEAIKQAAALLNITPRQIGFAGLKDAKALTSQRISLRRTSWQKVSTIVPGSHIFLKPKSAGKGAMAIGQLSGNRFTILVRTESSTDEEQLGRRAQTLQRDGFANYYGVQRFGNRLLNPHLGKLLCQGKPLEAIKIYLTTAGPFDTPIYKEVRRRAALQYGQWADMLTTFDKLPYSFRYERLLLKALIAHEDNWPRVLLAIEDQVRFWVYSYASYVVNHLLSRVLHEGLSIPDPLPLPLGGPHSDELYAEYLSKHGIASYHEQLKPYPYVIQKTRAITPWITPQVHQVATVPAGSLLSFTLPKAAYATTFLMFLFRLYEGSPTPPWVIPDEIDSKAALGTGSVREALVKLGNT